MTQRNTATTCMLVKILPFVCFSLICLAIHFPATSALSPIVIVPGIGGSQIEAQLDRQNVKHYWCDKKYPKWYTIWLSIEELLGPLAVVCWTDDIKMVYNDTTARMQNTEGVHTRVPGFGNTSSIEYLDPSLYNPGQYFAPFVDAIVKQLGYKRGISIRAAPYDFRYSPSYAAKYFEKLKTLMEETYLLNGKQKILLISQSMGCPYTLHFLDKQSQAWKNTYIKAWITISGVWGGAVKALRAYISGDPFGAPPFLDRPIYMRPAQRSYTSLAYILPSKAFWKSDEFLVQTAKRSYTVADYESLFTDMNYPLGYDILRSTISAWIPTPPGVPLYCLHGIGLETPGRLTYGPGEFPDEQPKVLKDDGDGTVNIRSLKGCLRWEGQQDQPIVYKTYSGAEHNGILGDVRLLKDINQIIHNLTIFS